MKRCPKCNKVFENERRFCTHDGGELITDEFALPSEFEDKETEEQTVLRVNPPIRIPAQRARSVPVPVQPAAREYAGNDVGMPGTSPVKKSGGCLKYSIILILGLLIGGGVVLAVVGAGFWYLSVRSRIEKQAEVEPTPFPRPTKPALKIRPQSKHGQRNTNLGDSDVNGRVIASSAVVRALPSKSSNRVDVIPRADRLNIKRRQSETSPWYEIECEHGISGWVHGNAIEFVE